MNLTEIRGTGVDPNRQTAQVLTELFQELLEPLVGQQIASSYITEDGVLSALTRLRKKGLIKSFQEASKDLGIPDITGPLLTFQGSDYKGHHIKALPAPAPAQYKHTKKLNRLLIVDWCINDNTPQCVLEEIAHIHNIKWSPELTGLDLMNSINKKELIDSPGEPSDLAWFISGSTTPWSKRQLTTAFEFLQQFMRPNSPFTDDPKLGQLEIKSLSDIGNQTPTQPRRVNLCLLHRYLDCYGVRFNRQMTVEDMYKIYTWTKMSNMELSRLMPRCNFSLANSNDVIRILITGKAYHTDMVSSEGLVAAVGKDQADPPQTTNDAVIQAAMKYQVDLSLTEDPLAEFYQLQAKPLSYESKKWPRSRLSLTQYFNPLLPQECYKPKVLTALALSEGYSRSYLDSVNPYSALQMTCLTKTFYESLQPEVSAETTELTSLELQQLNHVEVLSFGTRTFVGKPGEMIAITFEELNGYFKSKYALTNPFEVADIKFESHVLVKLKRLCSSIESKHATILLNTINDIETMLPRLTELVKPLRSQCHKSTVARENTHRVLKAIFELAMYIRGWDGDSEDQPLADVPALEESLVLVKVTEQFTKINSFVDEQYQTIMELPVVLYKSGSYRLCTKETDGITFRQRFEVVLEGQKDNACIRTNSNWLALSANLYVKLLGLEEFFDVEKFQLLKT